MQPKSEHGRRGEQNHGRQVNFRGARQQSEEWENEHQRHADQSRYAPAIDQAQSHPVRLFAEVAVPDDQILAESDVAPKRGEREAEFAKIMEVLVLDEIVATQESSPRHDDDSPAGEGRDPRPHEEPPAVHRALKMWIERHGKIPRQYDPSKCEREGEENGKPALK